MRTLTFICICCKRTITVNYDSVLGDYCQGCDLGVCDAMANHP